MQVDESHTLPQSLTTALGDLQDQHMLCSIPIRKTPPEFQAVFSDKCVVLMPEGSSVRHAAFCMPPGKLVSLSVPTRAIQ